MKKIVILGGAGTGEIIASVVDRMQGVVLKGFINDYIPVGDTIGKFKKIPVVAKTDELKDMISADKDLYVISGYAGTSDPQKSYGVIQKLTRILPEDRWFNAIDPTAVVPWEYCRLGKGIFIGPLAQVCVNTVIADHCILMGNAFVSHHTVLDEFAHITTNAVVGSNVKIGRGTHVGSNSVIREMTTIGDFSLVGSGAVVVNDVPDNTVVVGNPARILRKRDEKNIALKNPLYIPLV